MEAVPCDLSPTLCLKKVSKSLLWLHRSTISPLLVCLVGHTIILSMVSMGHTLSQPQHMLSRLRYSAFLKAIFSEQILGSFSALIRFLFQAWGETSLSY